MIDLDYLNSLLSTANQMYQENPSTWAVAAAAIVAVVMVWYVMRIRDPRYQERMMAKKQEREKISDILSKALDDAVEKDQITIKVRLKWLRRLGRRLDLPDLIPRENGWTGFGKPDLNKVRLQVVRSLTLANVPIKDALKRMRRRRDKKAKLANIKKVQPIPLP